MRLVWVTHIWLVSTESVGVEIIILNHMEPEPVVSADVEFRTMFYFWVHTVQVSHQSLELCRWYREIDLELQSDLSAVGSYITSYLKKKVSLFLVYLECFPQSAGIVGGKKLGAGMRKRRKRNSFFLLWSSTFSSGCRMRFGKLVGVIQPIWVIQLLTELALWFFLVFQWEQRWVSKIQP